jgi:hypothetical protein
MGEMGNAYSIFVGKSEGKRPLERPRCTWEDGILGNKEESCELDSSVSG